MKNMLPFEKNLLGYNNLLILLTVIICWHCTNIYSNNSVGRKIYFDHLVAIFMVLVERILKVKIPGNCTYTYIVYSLF